MSPIDLGSYKSIYLQTAKEYVNNMSVSLAKLETNIIDKEAINNVHISSHSLKSQSQVMGFNDIANLCLNIEKSSNDILNNVSQANDGFTTLLKSSINEINLKIAEIEKTQ